MVFRAILVYGVWAGSNHNISQSCRPRPPTLCPARVPVLTPLSQSLDCRFFVFVHVRPDDALPTADPGDDEVTVFAHTVVQGYICGCVIVSIFLCCIGFTCFV